MSPQTTAMDPTLRALLLARLTASPLDEAARDQVKAVTGTDVPAPTETEQQQAAAQQEVYLRSVTVEGFRGIGPAATLALDPQPGLTVVVGRNGSGKSSFAEGLELLLTAKTKRWADRQRTWSSAWQCLHHDGPTRLQAELVVGGEGAPVQLAQEWAPGVAYDDATHRTAVAATLDGRGWTSALETFRPFLAYSELAGMFDKLTTFYAALSPVLGLDDLTAALEELRQRRLTLEAHGKELKAETAALRASLAPDDPRQTQLDALLATTKPDLAAIAEHLTKNPHGTSAPDATSKALRQIAALPVPSDEDLQQALDALAAARQERDAARAGDAARSLQIATLLEQALQVRDTSQLADDCPVCGTASVLDEAWARRATEQAAALKAGAQRLAQADAAYARAASTCKQLGDQLRRVVEDAPAELSAEQALQLAARARKVVEGARKQLEEQDTIWRTRIDATLAWLPQAKRVRAEATRLAALKKAETWLKGEADTLRNERFAPIADQAKANWDDLKHASSVDLHDITLKGKQASFDVRADGLETSAMGVMSQGELLALSVSVFLPRAGLDESPFRFAVIDDPVQSMDPAKVDGLARVLQRAAKTRQVVVFTHDDRLPEAVRRLKVPATVLQVNRRAGSQVAVQPSPPPVMRHLKDAGALLKSPSVPAEVRQRVVPSLCRESVEAACASLVVKRVIAEGKPASAADDRLEGARKLRQQLALALAVAPEELNARLLELDPGAVATVNALNAGAHGTFEGDVGQLRTRTQDLVVGLMQS